MTALSLPSCLFIALKPQTPRLRLLGDSDWQVCTVDGIEFRSYDGPPESVGHFDWLRDNGGCIRGVRWDVEPGTRWLDELAESREFEYIQERDGYYQIGFGMNPLKLHVVAPEQLLEADHYVSEAGIQGVSFGIDLMYLWELRDILRERHHLF